MKTATRNKHTPLNQYVSFSQTPAAAGDSDTTLDEILPGPSVHDPVNQVIAAEELESLVACLSGVSGVLSDLESRVLSLYLDGHSYEVVAERLECDTKTVDNALQRVKRKVGSTSPRARSPPKRSEIGQDIVEQVAAVVRGDGDVVGLDSDPVQRLHAQDVAVGAGGWGRRRRRRRRVAPGGRRPAPSPGAPAAGRRRRVEAGAVEEVVALGGDRRLQVGPGTSGR